MLQDQVFSNDHCIEDDLKARVQNAVLYYLYDGVIFNWVGSLACCM